MTIYLIRFVAYVIAINILYAVLNHLNTRDSSLDGDDTHYTVRIPREIKTVYFSLFVMGLILFIVFFIFKLLDNESITNGHFWFTLIIMGIGLLVMYFSTRWRIVVNEENIKVYKIWGIIRETTFSDIDSVELTKKAQLVIRVKGKKLTIVDGLTDNYFKLKSDLIKHGKLKLDSIS